MSDESDTEDIGDVIESYRHRRERMGNIIIYSLIGLALIAGFALVYIWISGENGIALPFLASETPLPTPTFTITPTLTQTPTPPPTVVSPTLTETPACPSEYTVLSGETLSSIAAKCKLDSFLPILAANPSIGNGANIQPGQKIKIPPPGTEITPTEIVVTPGTIVQILVVFGDNLKTIADRCHTTTDDLKILNGIVDPNKINAGDTLKCHYGWATPAPTTKPSPTSGNSLTPANTAGPAPTSTRAP
jgi:LysM repeat protein